MEIVYYCRYLISHYYVKRCFVGYQSGEHMQDENQGYNQDSGK